MHLKSTKSSKKYGGSKIAYSNLRKKIASTYLGLPRPMFWLAQTLLITPI